MRVAKKDRAKLFAIFCALAVAAAVVRYEPMPPTQKPDGAPWRQIVRVVDGDTVKLDCDETVRLIGVDAPESSDNRKLRKDLERMGKDLAKAQLLMMGIDATAFVRECAEEKRCWLEYEGKSRRDLYGRTLAYIHLEDGVILNEHIIRQGYGRAYLDYPFRYKNRYLQLQDEARTNKRGLWAETD